MNEKFPYEDIVNLPHPVSRRHAPMGRIERAAQFSPFAALTGYEDAIEETARLTDIRPALSEEDANLLDERVRILREHRREEPEVTVTRFLPDPLKAGGSVVPVTGTVHTVDMVNRTLVFTDHSAIPLADILKLEGSIFRQEEPSF